MEQVSSEKLAIFKTEFYTTQVNPDLILRDVKSLPQDDKCFQPIVKKYYANDKTQICGYLAMGSSQFLLHSLKKSPYPHPQNELQQIFNQLQLKEGEYMQMVEKSMLFIQKYRAQYVKTHRHIYTNQSA